MIEPKKKDFDNWDEVFFRYMNVSLLLLYYMSQIPKYAA